MRFSVKLFFVLTEIEDRNFEERFAIKFYVKLGETGIETSKKMKQAYG